MNLGLVLVAVAWILVGLPVAIRPSGTARYAERWDAIGSKRTRSTLDRPTGESPSSASSGYRCSESVSSISLPPEVPSLAAVTP